MNVASGFVVPRLISDQLGQSVLGVWDLCWTFVAYFGLVQLGLGGSVGRYVSHYRARNDLDGLNRSVSTIAVFQRSVGWLALVLAILTAWAVLPLLDTRHADDLQTARRVILILGTEISITIMMAVYGSVITGCHRWDLHNTVSAVAYGAAGILMTGVLLSGGGLTALAMVHCLTMVGAELVRLALVRRVCPELIIRRHLASWTTFVEQARYSIKSLIPSISSLLSNQAVSMLIAAFLGPASLAVFSRSRALMTALRTLAMKFGMIVVPTASAMHARSDRQALRETLLTTTALISSLVLPVLIAIGLLGDGLIRLWMGHAYVLHGLLPILSVGTYATLVQEPVWSLLAGMNSHGKVSWARFAGSTASALFLAVGLWALDWGLLGAAVCLALPQLVVDGLITPAHACNIVGVRKRIFFWRVLAKPGLCSLPFALSLLLTLKLGYKHPVLATGAAVLGSITTLLCYLKWLLPHPLRNRPCSHTRQMPIESRIATNLQ